MYRSTFNYFKSHNRKLESGKFTYQAQTSHDSIDSVRRASNMHCSIRTHNRNTVRSNKQTSEEPDGNIFLTHLMVPHEDNFSESFKIIPTEHVAAEKTGDCCPLCFCEIQKSVRTTRI